MMNGPTSMPISLDEPVSPHSLDSSSQHNSTFPPEQAPKDDKQTRPNHNETRTSSRFSDLPREVIQRILWTADANTFASMCMLNKAWHGEAQSPDLYAHHLSRCPSYALSNSVITGPFHASDLVKFKARFATEVRRNLFDAFTRPRRTFVKLISISANSAAAFPGGEAFRFEFSPNGQTMLALSSSRIYVLDATTEVITVKRELKTLRRPLSASITDDGSLLAVLSSKFQANVYGLPPGSKIKHLQVIVLENAPKTIAIAHEGTVLAASYDTGVEVFSLAANALSTDRRAVRSEAVDTLTFSTDGSMLIGSSLNLDEPNAVVISAPFYTENDPDLTPREAHSRMWTTQILFPQISSVCSHVALLPNHAEGDATWLFAYDHSLLSYRAVRTDDTRTGVAYFLTPPGTSRFSLPSPTIAPVASTCGTLAIAGFSGTGLCLFGIPEKLDIGPDMAAVIERHEHRLQSHGPLTTATGNMDPLMAYSPSMSARSESLDDDTIASKVDWRQSLFVKCKAIETIKGHTAAKWLDLRDQDTDTPRGKRLIIVAPGGLGTTGGDFGEEPVPLDGSRLCLLDFDYAPSKSDDREITIEVGDNETELLVEHTGSIATEVAMERRRTIRGMPGAEHTRRLLGRSVTAITPASNFPPQEHTGRQSVSQPSSPVEEPTKRRQGSNSSLQRSASATGFRHALYPPRPPLGSQQYMPPGMGPGGRPGSVDSWETPPPPYIDGGLLHGPSSQNFTTANQNQGAIPTNESAPLDPAAAQHQAYLHYRSQPARGSVGMDGMPITDTGPVRRSMSQYGALARNQRLRDASLSSLDTVTEASMNRHAVKSMDLSSSSSGFNPSGQMIDAFVPRPRPFTHYGSSHSPDPRIGSTLSHPISPLVSPGSTFSSNGFVSPESTSRLSLTGANLQNRLNLPVPPVPEGSSIPEIPEEYRNPVPPPATTSSHHVQPSNHQISAAPTQQTTPTRDALYLPANQFHREAPPRKPLPMSALTGSPPENSQLTSDAHLTASRHGSSHPTFLGNAPVDSDINEHAGNPNPTAPTSIPNQQQHLYSSRNSQASASTPNLLRPSYNTRLDNVEPPATSSQRNTSPGIAFNIGRRMSRAQSMIHGSMGRDRHQQPPRQYREQSAYEETVQTMPDAPSSAAGRAGKKSRRKEKPSKDEGERTTGKKGAKCKVM